MESSLFSSISNNLKSSPIFCEIQVICATFSKDHKHSILQKRKVFKLFNFKDIPVCMTNLVLKIALVILQLRLLNTWAASSIML